MTTATRELEVSVMGKSRNFWALMLSVAVVCVTAATSGAASDAASVGAGPQLERWHGWHFFTAVTVMSRGSALTVGKVDVDGGCCAAMSQHWDGTDWTYANPHVGDRNILASVASLSETDAWAVGFDSTHQLALTEHWNGHRWGVVASGRGSQSVGLNDVSMVAPNDVWAVGTYTWGEGGKIPAVMHWDGTTWTRLADPFAEGTLDAIDAISADDIWTTGLYSDGIWHWDGTAWTQFTNPLDGYFSMSAVSTNDVWLAGQLGGRGFAHWDGQTWSYVDSPALGDDNGQLWDVTALSKKNAWAVGNTYTGSDPDRAVIEHWNGHKWTNVPCPHTHQSYEMLTAVDARAPDDVWAIGTAGANPIERLGHRFMLHWDGTSWTRYHHT